MKIAGTGQRVTLQHVAVKCGVSRITVSYALRGERRFVSQATIDRVRAVAGKMGYDPALSASARRLRYQGMEQRVVNYLAAAFFPFGELQHPYWALILAGLESGFLAQRFGVLSSRLDGEESMSEYKLPYLFHRGDVDGVVVFPTEQRRENLVSILRAEPGFGTRPIISVVEPLAGCSSVLVDDHQVGLLAAGHLLDLGHRSLLAFKSSRYNAVPIRDRFDGYRKACADRQLNPDDVLCVADWIWEDKRGLDIVLSEVLKRFPGVTGVLCPNDGLGVELARAIRRLGLRIPEDLSLVGVDDCEELEDGTGRNMWTTVQIHLQQFGAEAARLLIHQIVSGSSETEEKRISVELVQRGSTRPPPRRKSK